MKQFSNYSVSLIFISIALFSCAKKVYKNDNQFDFGKEDFQWASDPEKLTIQESDSMYTKQKLSIDTIIPRYVFMDKLRFGKCMDSGLINMDTNQKIRDTITRLINNNYQFLITTRKSAITGVFSWLLGGLFLAFFLLYILLFFTFDLTHYPNYAPFVIIFGILFLVISIVNFSAVAVSNKWQYLSKNSFLFLYNFYIENKNYRSLLKLLQYQKSFLRRYYIQLKIIPYIEKNLLIEKNFPLFLEYFSFVQSVLNRNDKSVNVFAQWKAYRDFFKGMNISIIISVIIILLLMFG